MGIENNCIFALSNKSNALFEQLIDNKPLGHAFGSILEGRFSFYKVNNIIRHALRGEFEHTYSISNIRKIE